MERAAWLERRFGAAIEWLPFDLHPEYPREGIPIDDGTWGQLAALAGQLGVPVP